MVAAHIVDTTHVLVTYNKAVTAADFSSSSFTSDPSAEINDSQAQTSANSITLEYLADISADTNLTFVGLVANVITPQNINYT